MTNERPEGETRQRIDKWLFFARIAKSRSIAQFKISAGNVRLNGNPINQPSRQVQPGDRLEISMERRILVLLVKQPGARRGPYEEAKLLYEDVTPPETSTGRLSALDHAVRNPGSGRPTKKERRALERIRQPESSREE